jgi:hypothetical protein
MKHFYLASDYQGFSIGGIHVYAGYEYGYKIGLDEYVWGFYVEDNSGNLISHRPMTDKEQDSLESGEIVSLGYLIDLVANGVIKIGVSPLHLLLTEES